MSFNCCSLLPLTANTAALFSAALLSTSILEELPDDKISPSHFIVPQTVCGSVIERKRIYKFSPQGNLVETEVYQLLLFEAKMRLDWLVEICCGIAAQMWILRGIDWDNRSVKKYAVAVGIKHKYSHFAKHPGSTAKWRRNFCILLLFIHNVYFAIYSACCETREFLLSLAK